MVGRQMTSDLPSGTICLFETGDRKLPVSKRQATSKCRNGRMLVFCVSYFDPVEL